MIVIGQLANIIPETLCAWAKERKFSASLEAGKFADDSLQAVVLVLKVQCHQN